MAKKYKFKKTCMKMAAVFVWILAAGFVINMTGNDWFVLLVPVLEGLKNYLKHNAMK